MFTLRFLLHVYFPKRCPITDRLTAHSSKWIGLIALLSIATKYIETSGRNVVNKLRGCQMVVFLVRVITSKLVTFEHVINHFNTIALKRTK
jgi:hypothetical protein